MIRATLLLAALLAAHAGAHAAPAPQQCNAGCACLKPAKHVKRKHKAPAQTCAAVPAPLPLAVPPVILPPLEVEPLNAPITFTGAPPAVSTETWATPLPLPQLGGLDFVGGGGVSITQPAAKGSTYSYTWDATYYSTVTNSSTSNTYTTVNNTCSGVNDCNHVTIIKPRGMHRAPEVGIDGAVSAVTLLLGLLAITRGRRQCNV